MTVLLRSACLVSGSYNVLSKATWDLRRFPLVMSRLSLIFPEVSSEWREIQVMKQVFLWNLYRSTNRDVTQSRPCFVEIAFVPWTHEGSSAIIKFSLQKPFHWIETLKIEGKKYETKKIAWIKTLRLMLKEALKQVESIEAWKSVK